MKQLAAELRQHGYKLTPQRRAILDVIAVSHEHLSPAAIYDEVHRKHPDVGRVTVYRTLEVLARLGLICEVHTGGKERSFVKGEPAAHHHHLVCSGCGKVVDFAACDLAKLEHRLSRETGFAIDDHLLELHGRCPRCAGAAR